MRATAVVLATALWMMVLADRLYAQSQSPWVETVRDGHVHVQKAELITVDQKGRLKALARGVADKAILETDAPDLKALRFAYLGRFGSGRQYVPLGQSPRRRRHRSLMFPLSHDYGNGIRSRRDMGMGKRDAPAGCSRTACTSYVPGSRPGTKLSNATS